MTPTPYQTVQGPESRGKEAALLGEKALMDAGMLRRCRYQVKPFSFREHTWPGMMKLRENV